MRRCAHPLPFATATALVLLAAALTAAPVADATARGRSARAQASARLGDIVELGRQSGVPTLRARALELCIAHDRKARATCAKEGAGDPAREVRVAVARALYRAKRGKEAKALLKALLADPRVPWRGVLERVLRIDGKAGAAARKDLLTLLADPSLANAADRVREIARGRDDGARALLVAGATGRADPPRGDFRASLVTLDARRDADVLGRIFREGDDELRMMVLGRAERVPVGAELPGYLLSAKVREKKPGRLTRALGELLARHRRAEAEPYLLAALGASDDPSDQRALLMLLAEVASQGAAKALRPYTDKAKHKSPVRVAAWAALMRARDAKALGRVPRWLQTSDAFRREMATWGLAFSQGKDASAQLQQLLFDGQAGVRRAAAGALAEVAGGEAVDALRRALSSQTDRDERRVLARALFAVIPADRMPEVSYFLQDGDEVIRTLALEAFVGARTAQLAPYLRPLLTDTDPSVRARALEGILLSDPKEGMLEFGRALNWLDGSELLVWTRAQPARMAPYVKKALTSPREQVRDAALDAMALLPTAERNAVALGWVEQTTAPAVRVRLLEALVEGGSSRATTVLERFAADEDVLTRAAAVRLLAASRKGSDLVVKALDDTELEVQIEAASGLLR